MIEEGLNGGGFVGVELEGGGAQLGGFWKGISWNRWAVGGDFDFVVSMRLEQIGKGALLDYGAASEDGDAITDHFEFA